FFHFSRVSVKDKTIFSRSEGLFSEIPRKLSTPHGVLGDSAPVMPADHLSYSALLNSVVEQPSGFNSDCSVFCIFSITPCVSAEFPISDLRQKGVCPFI